MKPGSTGMRRGRLVDQSETYRPIIQAPPATTDPTFRVTCRDDACGSATRPWGFSLRSKRWSGGGRETDEGHENQQNDECIKQYLFPIEAVATRARHNKKTSTQRRVKEREREKEGGGGRKQTGHDTCQANQYCPMNRPLSQIRG